MLSIYTPHDRVSIGATTGRILQDEIVAVRVAATRERRLVAAQGITAEAVAAAVLTSDRNRGDYFRRFYDIAQEQPTHYDLVVNTDVFTPEQVAAVIVCAAQDGPCESACLRHQYQGLV